MKTGLLYFQGGYKLDITLCTYVSVVGLKENWSSGFSRGILQVNNSKHICSLFPNRGN